MNGLPIELPLASSNSEQTPRPAGPAALSRTGTVGISRGAKPLGSRRLAAVARNLSDREWEVLRSIEQLRLATSRHLEALHYTDAATPLTAARKARRTLQRLVDLGLLQRLERRIGGLHAGSAGYIYAVASAGQRLLEVPGPRRRRSEPNELFVEHTLAITELAVAIHQRARSDPDRLEVLDLQTEPTCWRPWTGLGGNRELLRPDLYLTAGVGEDELRWFIELDRGTEHQPAVKRKLRAYQAYFHSGTEQDRDGVFPQVAWVVPNDARAAQLSNWITHDSELRPGLFATLLEERAAEQLLT
jgi:hypothetical protein